MTLDHRVPLTKGGAHDLSNLVAACKSCNSRKRTRDELEFRAELALEAFIEGCKGELSEAPTPYRTLGSCRTSRQGLVWIADNHVPRADRVELHQAV